MNIALSGATGRMGQQVVKAVSTTQGIAISQALVSAQSEYLGRDIGEITGTNIRLPCTSALTVDCDVLIDFSTPEASMSYLEQIEQLAGKTCPAVICTTGLNEQQNTRIEQLAKTIPLLKASNTSIGITLLLQLVRQAAEKLPDADIEIIEAHHRNKIDSPSGTALSLGEAAASVRGMDLDQAIYQRQGIDGIRPHGPPGFATIRGGGIIGDHSVLLALEDECIEISHRALNRSLFATGAIKAALWLIHQPAGRLYSMEHVLGKTYQ